MLTWSGRNISACDLAYDAVRRHVTEDSDEKWIFTETRMTSVVDDDDDDDT